MRVDSNSDGDLGKIIKQRRASIPLTLFELGTRSGVSQSHLGRIERGERFPSAHVLRKIAKPLGCDEDELFMLAGFLSELPLHEGKLTDGQFHNRRLDPLVAQALACEPVEVQRATIGILSLLRSFNRSSRENK